MTTAQLLDSHRIMLRIRLFEDQVDALFARGVVRGTSHLYAGQEAVAVGVCQALRPEDAISSTHRGHGHFIAKGGAPKRIMAELFGKATGYGGGKGGSQHMACHAVGFLGSNGITGGGLPIATGAALAMQHMGEDRVVVCFFGDGAANQGTFHESLNMAAVWKLPVVYVCENNLYAMFTPMQQVTSVRDIATRASAYGMPGDIVDGNDLEAVHSKAATAIERARAGQGPTLIEAKTYRFYGHSKSDQRLYRTKEEEAEWRRRDPIPAVEAELKRRGIDAAVLEAVGEEEQRLIAAAVEFAENSPDPPFEAATQGVFAE